MVGKVTVGLAEMNGSFLPDVYCLNRCMRPYITASLGSLGYTSSMGQPVIIVQTAPAIPLS